MSALAPLVVGAGFGWMLQKARLGRYETIVNVFRLVDLTVLQFLMSAMLVAMVGVQALVSLGLAAPVPVPHTYALGNLAGGVVFGAGMALAGFCPGTVAAGAGEGRLDYLIPGALGLYTGAVVFGWVYPRLVPPVARIGDLGTTTAARGLGVSAWLVIALFWELGLLVFYAIERGRRPPRV